MTIPGLGPKTVRAIWQTLNVTDLVALNKCIADGTILTVPRMGQKAVDKIKAAIAIAAEGTQRLRLGQAVPIAQRVIDHLKKTKAVKEIAYAGSLRRGRETVADIDILVSTTDAAAVAEAFRTMPDVRQVIASGEGKSSVRIAVDPDDPRWDSGEGDGAGQRPGSTIQTDLRIIPPESWGAGMMYFTGSKDHNIRLRGRALDQGLTLNEFGLFPNDKDPTPPQHRGLKPVASKTEDEIYKRLGLPYIPPRDPRGPRRVRPQGNTAPRRACRH
jgi:DNA polymerase (family 10)